MIHRASSPALTEVSITVRGGLKVAATLARPPGARGVVVFAHGSGSSRHSPRNQHVAGQLNRGGYTTVLLDLLTAAEGHQDERDARWRFDIDLLAARLTQAVDWLTDQANTRALPIGLFGASTGAAAALITAAQRPEVIKAVVSRGGRPDLAGSALTRVKAPTLLIVGSNDEIVIDLNVQALRDLGQYAELVVVKGAGHLFSEPGTLDEVAEHAIAWFGRHLRTTTPTAA
jgi:dienelactone hydrolase